MQTMHLLPIVAIQPNLELKTRPKQLLGSLPLVIVLEERLECGRALTGQRKREKERDARASNSLSLFLTLFLLSSLPLSPTLSLYLSPCLTGEQGSHTLFTSQRERVKKRERERIVIFISKRNDGCLGTFWFSSILEWTSFSFSDILFCFINE